MRDFQKVKNLVFILVELLEQEHKAMTNLLIVRNRAIRIHTDKSTKARLVVFFG